MTSSTPTRPSTPVRIVALGIVAALVLFLAGGLLSASANAETQARLVWICKYVGSPDDPRFQRVMSTSTSATDGAWFTDGQLPSKVIRAVADGENAGQAPAGLEAECPETPPGPETPPVTETTPPVTTTTTPAVTTTTSAPAVKTTAPVPPKAAPTDLGSSQSTGMVALFAIAATLLGGAALALRRGGEH